MLGDALCVSLSLSNHEGRKMTTKLLAVLTNRLTLAGLLCCLWVATNANTAQAQGLANQQITTKQTVYPPPKGTVYSCKGTVAAVNLPAGSKSVSVSIAFERRAKGVTDWTPFIVDNQKAVPMAGGASFDTGWLEITPTPAVGEQFRISVTGSYVDAMGNTNLFNLVESAPDTPRP